MSSGWNTEHRQTGTVVEYRHKFIELIAPLDDIPGAVAKGQFINDLKDEMKAEVRLHGPTSLDHAMDLTVKVEDKMNYALSKRIGPNTSSSKVGQFSNSNSFISGHISYNSTSTLLSSPTTPRSTRRGNHN